MMHKTPTMHITVARHNAYLVDALDALADRHNVSRSETVFRLVREETQRAVMGASK